MPSAMSRAIDPVGITSIGHPALFAEAHDRALAELALDLGQGRVKGLLAVVGGTGHGVSSISPSIGSIDSVCSANLCVRSDIRPRRGSTVIGRPAAVVP